MSMLKPAAKMAKTTPTSSPLTRTASVGLVNTEEEEKNRRTPSLQTSTPEQTTKHPKGHRVRDVKDVWKIMDSQDFLHLTDTLALGDVWVQPLGVESSKGAFATVKFIQIVEGPHIKYRYASCKLSLDDLTKMLYLADCLNHDLQRVDRLSFEDWLNDKSALCVKAKGIEEGSDRGKLCHFIITEDSTFRFYPLHLRGDSGIFFRKICYHSYKSDDVDKIENPSMIKCKATKGSFEYIIEARIFPFPPAWFDALEHHQPQSEAGNTTEMPESQPY